MNIADRFRRSSGVKTAEMTEYLTEVKGLERNFIREVLRSRKNAWMVAGLAAFLAFVALMVLAVYMKESSRPVPPFILRVDNATGAVDAVSVMKEHQDSYGEVVDQYWLNQYVLHRESYDYQTIQTDYDATGLMSTSDVAVDYHKVFEGDQARDKVLADKARVLVNMESAPVINTTNSTAVARFTTIVHWRNNRPDEVRHWIATIAYAYVDAPMKPQDRLVNPLGFQVTSYRVDPELGAAQ
ncbi:Inner membrane protein forms channel for type IV secretion of T-DNA complex, VirB8 [Candidatus Burkholderia verschuerenii]|uniref:Inner membrane protein forms channel for type IV secretion of T-DNA complex, VirB8 n=1 Tax=Candidatus Burkholderia verschuerenii TaxID=242163 RepID=A0A0L0MEA3_9BURK|nr:type IV secretion system protein [Candidatus Burkholderia verschuerenii]KND60585.1 Inner membrane protein forms channel for type IV secretion of T-DNA complex, VirB8 [Candidatus Burkholderia verschuerenii]